MTTIHSPTPSQARSILLPSLSTDSFTSLELSTAFAASDSHPRGPGGVRVHRAPATEEEEGGEEDEGGRGGEDGNATRHGKLASSSRNRNMVAVVEVPCAPPPSPIDPAAMYEEGLAMAVGKNSAADAATDGAGGK